MSGYIFDNAAESPTSTRFGSLEALYDPRTIRFLEATGVGDGWRCLEVGAGSGSIAAWLAGRVGERGHVLATDIDPRFLTALADSGRPNVEVCRHDVGTDPLPAEAFDLIHARLDRANFAQVREAAVGAGLIAAEGIDRMLALLDDPTLACASPTMFSVWGRRP